MDTPLIDGTLSFGGRMKTKIRLLLVAALLLLIQMACNLPGQVRQGQPTPLPGPNQTLTALFAITLPAQPTATLPPVATVTSPGAASPTATQSPAAATAAPTITQAASASPTATKTLAPLQTSTIPSVRPRAQVVANYLNTPPTIDGDWSEWKNITIEYPANLLVWGKDNWANEDDLAGSFHIGWDDNNLYIAVKVRDDVYVQNATDADIYKGDSIELLLDTNIRDDYYYAELSPDDFQLGISPGNPKPDGTRSAYLWYPRAVAGARNNIKIGARLEGTIYRVEAAIPWSVFETTPASGKHYGFALSVNDNDDGNSNVQQSMVSNVSIRKLSDPTTWGDLHLVR